MMKTLLTLLSVLFLAGCAPSFLGVALESMTVSKVDDYFDLDRSQKETLKKDVERDMAEVRRDVFPQIAESLRRIETQTGKNEMSPELVAQLYSDAEQSLRKITSRFEKSAVQIAGTLQDKQFRYFEKKVDRDVENSIEETDGPDKALKQSMKRYSRSLKFWFGSVTKDQESQLRQFLKDHPYPWELQNKNKKFVLAKFLESKKSKETLKQFVVEYSQDFDAVRLPAFKTALEEHQKAFQKFFAESLWPKVEAKQKAELKENLLERAQILEKWARH